MRSCEKRRASIPPAHNEPHAHARTLAATPTLLLKTKKKRRHARHTRRKRTACATSCRGGDGSSSDAAAATLLSPSEADGDERTRRLLVPASTSFCRCPQEVSGRTNEARLRFDDRCRGAQGTGSFLQRSEPVSQSRAAGIQKTEHCTGPPSANPVQQTESGGLPVDRKRWALEEPKTLGLLRTTKARGRRTELRQRRRRRGRVGLQQLSRSVGDPAAES